MASKKFKLRHYHFFTGVSNLCQQARCGGKAVDDIVSAVPFYPIPGIHNTRRRNAVVALWRVLALAVQRAFTALSTELVTGFDAVVSSP